MIANSHDQDAEKKLLARYERIIEISQQLTSTLDHMALLRQIVAAAIELTDCEASSILLLDSNTGELRFELASNLTAAQFESIVVPLEGSIAGWVVSHGEARVIEDVTREPSFFKSVDDALQFQTRSVLAVPLKVQKRTIGVLEAVNKLNGLRFNDEDVRMLTILGGQAAIALENARLFQQSDFMAEMVHELRTPLSSLRTSIALLQRDDLPEQRRSTIVETMKSETERLIRLTSDFLDLARLESGRARLELAPVELVPLVEECVNITQAQADERGIQMRTEIEPVTIAADRGKFKQVLLNLITNAIKYNCEKGRVDVRASRLLRKDSAFVQIAVADTGYGISKENQRLLFQKFYRAADTSGFTQGTGLGLAIAKHIIEGHGGQIWMESEPGHGSTFYLTVPAVI